MSDNLISKIDDKLGRIRTHPEYSVCLARKTLENIRDEADRYSIALEEEESYEGASKKEKEKFRRESYNRLIEVQKVLASTGIAVTGLSCLGNILEPEKNPCRRFRMAPVEFGGFLGGVGVKKEFDGEEPQNIVYRMDDLAQRLKYSTDIHPIKRATDAHITLVQVQPYIDGNKRAARIVQNFFLESRGYPSAIINLEDRRDYLEILQASLRDRFNQSSSVYKPSKNEIRFQNFIAGRVLNSLGILEKELEKNRAYKIEFKGIHAPDLVMKIKHSIHGNPNTSLHVHLESSKKSNDVTFYVKGDVSLEEMKVRVKRFEAKYGIRYSISAYSGCAD